MVHRIHCISILTILTVLQDEYIDLVKLTCYFDPGYPVDSVDNFDIFGHFACIDIVDQENQLQLDWSR